MDKESIIRKMINLVLYRANRNMYNYTKLEYYKILTGSFFQIYPSYEYVYKSPDMFMNHYLQINYYKWMLLINYTTKEIKVLVLIEDLSLKYSSHRKKYFRYYEY